MNLNASADPYPDQNLNNNTGPEDNQRNAHEEECRDDELFLRATLLENHQLGTELLYNRYYQVLCNHAARYVGSREAAEDIVSEIFFQFYSRRIFERITTSYRAYLFRSVRNYGLNHLRWEASRKVSMEDKYDMLDAEGQQPDHITQYEELYQDLEKIIGDLPVQRRNIYIRFHFEGKSQKEIAEELGISCRTVEVQIYRARQTIRSLMKSKWFISVLLALLLV